jgi:hypothetical protein
MQAFNGFDPAPKSLICFGSITKLVFDVGDESVSEVKDGAEELIQVSFREV